MHKEQTLLDLNRQEREGLYYSDKGAWHSYLPVYDELFTPYRHQDINLFEVGYMHGGSAVLWQRYFSKAKIRLIDIDSCVPPPLCTGRVALDLCSIWDITSDYFKDFPPTIAIDDGSHLLEDQVYFVKTVYPILKVGGIMIIEDIQNIATHKFVFDCLGIPFEVVDLRDRIGRYDDVLLIYRKEHE